MSSRAFGNGRAVKLKENRDWGRLAVGTIVVASVVGGAILLLDRPTDIPSQQEGLYRVLTSAEIHEHFSGRTVEGKHVIKGFVFKHYYAPDGTLYSVLGEAPSTIGTWWVSPQGGLCLHLRGQELCRQVVNDHGVYQRMREMRDGTLKHVITYTSFSDEAPAGLPE